MRRHVRESCKIAPNAKNGDKGMELLYEHTLRKQEADISTLKEQNARLIEMMEAMLLRPAITQGDNSQVFNIQVNINTFGREDTSHVTPARVREILEASRACPALPEAASMAVMRAAMLVYSDPERPENLTAFLPNKKTNEVLVHASRPDGRVGWEIQPAQLVLPAIAGTSLDMLFFRHPFEDADRYDQIMRELKDNEARYAAGDELRPILVRNKELLARVLETLPIGG